MEFFCRVCGQPIIENESEYKEYQATLRKKNDKSLYRKYTINNVSLDEFDNLINNYFSHHKKKLISISSN